MVLSPALWAFHPAPDCPLAQNHCRSGGGAVLFRNRIKVQRELLYLLGGDTRLILGRDDLIVDLAKPPTAPLCDKAQLEIKLLDFEERPMALFHFRAFRRGEFRLHVMNQGLDPQALVGR